MVIRISAISSFDGNAREIGCVILNNNRASLDEKLLTIFPKANKRRQEVVKACKWLAGENAVQSVDFEAQNLKLRAEKAA